MSFLFKSLSILTSPSSFRIISGISGSIGSILTPQLIYKEDNNGIEADREGALVVSGGGIGDRGSILNCDGMLWSGFAQGTSWPSGARSLLELHTVTPGPYLLKLWKYFYQTC